MNNEGGHFLGVWFTLEEGEEEERKEEKRV